MSTYLPFIIAGLTAGSIYGLAGVGLVLTYKTSGVFNFAHGALATVSAYLFYVLHVEHELSWQLAAAIVILVGGPLMGLLLEFLARRIGTAPLAIQVASTVGLLLAIVAAVQLAFPDDTNRRVAIFLSDETVSVAQTNVRVADIITFVVALLLTVLLAALLRWTRLGAQMRAVVDNPHLLALFETSPTATRRIAWILGSVMVSISGVLFAPLMPLDPFTLTFLVVAAFGAAAVGAFTNLPLTFVGGLLIGVGAALSQKWFISGPLAGLPSSLPFLVLFVVLLVFPRKYLVGKRFVAQRTRPAWTAPAGLQVTGGVVLLAFMSIVPAFAGIHLTDWTLMVTTTILFLSLSLLVKTSGQVSLAHVSFAAIGAVTFSHLALGRGLPWLVALVVAGCAAIPIGAVLAIPAIRLTGLYLALATFGFGLTLQYMFYRANWMFGDSGSPLKMPRPPFLSGDTGYYYVALFFAVVVGCLVIGLTRSRLGRILRGIADSPLAVETNGANANVTRVLVFCLSAFLAALAGALGGVASQTVSGPSYNPITSLVYFVVIVVVFGSEPWNAVIAAAALILIPSYVSEPNTATAVQLVFGLLAIVLAVLPRQIGGVPSPLREFIDSRLRRKLQAPATTDAPRRDRVGEGLLEVNGITVRYGGITAVDDFDLVAPTGTITGLIGPNGAGKTTTFNAVSGLVRPVAGSVRLDGADITGDSVSARARAGLGRTFQKMELLESLTVRENVRLGAEASLSGINPVSHLLAKPGESARIAAATTEAIDLADLTELADVSVHHLSTGQRRLVELARCLAGNFWILLMDEPSSGLDHAETERFGQILTSAVAERGIGILLVEHDISFVSRVCSEVFVLDFGKPIFRGTPEQMLDSPIVRAAYLGDDDLDSTGKLTGAQA